MSGWFALVLPRGDAAFVRLNVVVASILHSWGTAVLPAAASACSALAACGRVDGGLWGTVCKAVGCVTDAVPGTVVLGPFRLQFRPSRLICRVAYKAACANIRTSAHQRRQCDIDSHTSHPHPIEYGVTESQSRDIADDFGLWASTL